MLNGPLGLVILVVSCVVALGTVGATIHVFWRVARELPRLLESLKL